MTTAYLFIGFISFLIWMALMQYIISMGTRTRERNAIEKAQLQILIKMALKAGVTSEEVGGILESHSKSERQYLHKITKTKKLNDMDGSYIIVAIASLLIWAGILSWIISSATKSRENILLQKAQLSIIIEMAIKADVPLERIQKILDEASKPVK